MPGALKVGGVGFGGLVKVTEPSSETGWVLGGVRGGSKGVKNGVKKTMAGLLNNVFFGKNLHVWHIRRLDDPITNPVPSGRDANGGQNPVASQNRFTIPYYLLCAASVVVDFWDPF